LRGLGVILALLAASSAHGQRIQVPTPLSDPAEFPPAVPPATAQPSLAPPSVSLGDVIQPANPAWDPYADPSAQPPALYPEGGYIQPDGTVARPINLLHEVRLEHTFLVGDSANDEHLEINSTEISASFAFPFFFNPSPVVVTPGFAVHLLDGPLTPPALGDLPPRLFDAYLDAAWQPVMTSWLSADLGLRVGVYSDFEDFTSDSIRVMARGLAVASFSARFQVAAGAVYLDRNEVKILPAGGFIWVPHQDTRYEIIFPYPRVSHRLTTIGNTDVWWYAGGEYGGGSWTIKHGNGASDVIDYNDLRVFTGLELVGLRGFKAWMEAGFVWDREIIYVSTIPPFKPDDTVMVRGGVSY
jgi:hypothetical protein